MKVAVSIPDPLFREAESVSRRLRVPRSQLYSRALEAYVRQHSGEEITKKLNSVLARIGAKTDPGWENPGLEVLRREKW
jgi:metal-responsive CopG/Arc/MetJ family transcriptional regulator